MNSKRRSTSSNQQSKIAGIACPFCGSTDTEMLALFGQQLMTTQHYCRNCHSAFEAVKWEDSESQASSKSQVTGHKAKAKS